MSGAAPEIEGDPAASDPARSDGPAVDPASPDPTGVLRDLEAVLVDRRDAVRAGREPAGSYTAGLLADDAAARERVQRKIMEEAFELCLELGREGRGGPRDVGRIAEEAADVVFHVLVGLVGAGVGLDAVLDELRRRRR